MNKDKDDIESLELSSLDKKLSRKLSSLASEYLRLGREIDERTADLIESRKVLKEAIDEIVLSLKPDDKLRVLSPTWRANKIRRSEIRVNPNKLAERGVDVEIIEYATEKKYGNWYVKIEAVEEKEKKKG